MTAIRKIPANISEIKSFSDNVKWFRLLPQIKGIRFKAGQFLHLAIEPYDPSFSWPESRVFSIANSPLQTDYIDILVSRVGKYTTKMFQTLDIGDEVWIKLPYGVFNFNDSLKYPTVLIAGGTGISPFISFIQYAIDIELNTAIHLNYGVRNINLLIIEDLLKKAKQKLMKFTSRIHVEDLKNGESELILQSGQLPVKEIVQESLKLDNPIFYLSGPPAMIVAFDNELNNCGVPQGNIKYDHWE